MRPAFALLKRDLRLATRSGSNAALALAFFLAVAALVPLGVGPDLALLARIAGGVLWVGGILAALLSLDRLFQADYEDGSLDLIALSPLSLETVAAVKIIAHWLTTGVPLALASPFLAVLFGLEGKAMAALFLTLLIGTPGVSAIGGIGAALALEIRRGGLILPLIVLPLLAPTVIFGSGYVLGALRGAPGGALLLLAAFSLIACALSPFAAAAALRANLAS